MNAVIFDMDGVLVDSERVVWESFRYAGEKTGVPDVERMAIIGLGLNDEAWIKRSRRTGPSRTSRAQTTARQRHGPSGICRQRGSRSSWL